MNNICSVPHHCTLDESCHGNLTNKRRPQPSLFPHHFYIFLHFHRPFSFDFQILVENLFFHQFSFIFYVFISFHFLPERFKHIFFRSPIQSAHFLFIAFSMSTARPRVHASYRVKFIDKFHLLTINILLSNRNNRRNN